MLTNILRSKGNQTMKFGQLIECDMRNIFRSSHVFLIKRNATETKFNKINTIHVKQQHKLAFLFSRLL